MTPEQFAERLRAQCFDLILAEYPSLTRPEAQVLELVGQLKKDVPVILLVDGFERKTTAECILKGAADCVDVDNIGHLPVAVHRALKDKAVRDQRDRRKKVAALGGAFIGPWPGI